ncbi:MAG: aconitase X catalytic domain-containing protein [Oscillospiraceae bacterium]|nr:aconitase X catalytic domain-containing protein [Oscillospiraceae bacterium]
MNLTPEQQALLNGSQGETMAKVVKTLVMYGDAFGAERMVPVTSKYGHTVISFGLEVMKPVYDLYDQLIEAGLTEGQKFTADPKPLDKNVPSSLIEDLVFKKIMYTQQKRYEAQLEKLGIIDEDSYSCTCYLDQMGNKPAKGEILSWAESSAVVYANSVLGARCNRNSGMLELMGSIAGFVPEFGLLTDEGRKATWIIDVQCKNRPEAQLLGSAIGMKVMEEVPYVKGMEQWLGTELDEAACTYLKDFGAATASNGAVGLYHIAGLTPEAKEQGEALICDNAQVYVIDDAELERVKAAYPVIWKDADAKPQLCFIGCPHMTLQQLHDMTNAINSQLMRNGLQKVSVPTVFTASPAVIREFEKTKDYMLMKSCGIVLSYICPLMYMNNPLCKKKAVITSSNKLRTYTSARYYTEADIIRIITSKEAKL